MIELTDRDERAVYVNPHHVKMVTEDGRGGTYIWFEWQPTQHGFSYGSNVQVSEPPKEVASLLRKALHPTRPFFYPYKKRPSALRETVGREGGQRELDEGEY